MGTRAKLIFLMLLFLTPALRADVHQKGLLSSLFIGARYSSQIQKRGVIFYPDFQVDPIFAFFLFDDRLEFLGDSIGFRDYIYSDVIRLRSRLVSISDNPLFPAHEAFKNTFPDREDTFEWSTSLEIFLPGYNNKYFAEIDINYSKDIVKHQGNYLELVSKVKITDFLLLNTKMEPNFVGSIGWGDRAHNQYYYGPDDSSSGFTNYSLGLWLALPEKVDRFYPNLQIMYFNSLGDHKNAQFSQNRSEGLLISFIAALSLM